VSGDNHGTRRPFTADAVEAARLAREVQELGFDAARTVVDRFVDLFGDFCAAAAAVGGRPGPGGAPVDGGAGSGAYQRLQSDVQRAADSYLGVLGSLNQASLAFFDTARARAGPKAEAESLLLPDVAPGGRSSARMWLHNTTTSTVTNVRPWTPGLVGHAGDALAPGAVAFTPERIERIDAGESREILVVVTLGDDVRSGSYHGQVLVERLPEAAFPMVVRVKRRVDG
jgi:hypothetical protein